MIRRSVWASGRLWLLATIFLCACGSVDPVVKIGLVGPFEGRHRAIGYDVIYSARLAVREINAKDGIGGYRIALVALDDGGDPELAKATADSLVIDPTVVAVVGHWLPNTSEMAESIYIEAGLAFVDTTKAPFGQRDPATLPADFRRDYEAVTPFDEIPGPNAGAAYDAYQLVWQALKEASSRGGRIDRANVYEALSKMHGMP